MEAQQAQNNKGRHKTVRENRREHEEAIGYKL